jgi:ABC-2 type transport system permease protein
MVYGGTTTVRQGATISGILMLIFAFLGGAFIQLQSFPPAVRRIAPISPFFWGNSGYQDLLQADGGVSDILPNVGVLAGLGVLLLGAGAALLQRRLGRGTV